MNPNSQETFLSDLCTRRAVEIELQSTYSLETSQKNFAVDTLLSTLPPNADEYYVLLGRDIVELSPTGGISKCSFSSRSKLCI